MASSSSASSTGILNCGMGARGSDAPGPVVYLTLYSMYSMAFFSALVEMEGKFTSPRVFSSQLSELSSDRRKPDTMATRRSTMNSSFSALISLMVLGRLLDKEEEAAAPAPDIVTGVRLILK